MRRLSYLAVILALLGCEQNSAEPTLAPTDANVVGSYALSTANGRLLPIVVSLTADEEWDLSADRFVISADNTWTDTTTYAVKSFASGSVTARQTGATGTYAIANGQINFIMTTGGTATFPGSVTGNTLSLLFNGGHFVYSR
jgi:hypothetical protein